MAEPDDGGGAVGNQHDLNGGGAGRDLVALVLPAPREHDPFVWGQLDELAARDVATVQVHPVQATGLGFELGRDPHPSGQQLGLDEVAVDHLG